MLKALNVLIDVVYGLIRKTKANLINSNKSKEKQVKNSFYAKYGDKHTQQVQVEDPLIIQDIEKEKQKYRAILRDSAKLAEMTTRSFWNKKRHDLPYLSEAARRLLNIPSSSAFIERFFSVCGANCRTRAGNMSPNVLIARSMLKTNMEILNGLKKIK
jgi:hypothetical protein